MKTNYNLLSILVEKDDKADLAVAARAGVSATIKGKPEQKVIAEWVKSGSAISNGNYEFIAVTKMGSGPDVLIRNNDTDEYFELEVKSAGGSRSAKTPAQSFSNPISVSFKPSGTTASTTLKNLARDVNAANGLAAKQNAINDFFQKKVEPLTKGFFDNLEFADGSHEGKSGGLYDQLKSTNIAFKTSHICHVALGTAFILKLSNFGPDISGQKLIKDATVIEAGDEGIKKIQFSGTNNLTDTKQQGTWAKAFPGALINAIATMAQKPSWAKLLDYLSVTDVTDQEFELIKNRQESYGLDVATDKKSIDWSSLLMEMCTNWADLNVSDLRGIVVPEKRRGFGIDSAIKHMGTAFWTCGYDNLVAVPYLPKDMTQERLNKGREILFTCLEKTNTLKGRVSNTVTQAFRSNLRVSATVGSTRRGALYSARDDLPTKVGFFALKALSENLASLSGNTLIFDEECKLEKVVRLFVATKYNKLSQESKALIDKYQNKFTASVLKKICKEPNIDAFIEDIIVNSPFGGATVPISPAYVERIWKDAADGGTGNFKSPRQLNGLLNAVFAGHKAKQGHGITPVDGIQPRNRKSLDAFEPIDKVTNLASNTSLSDLENYPKDNTNKKQFKFWSNIMDKVSRITRIDNNLKSAIDLSTLDGEPNSLSRYDLYSALGFNVESKQRQKPFYKNTLANILFEKEGQEIEGLIDNVDGIDNVKDAAALTVKKTTDSPGGIDQILNKMETLGLMVLTDVED